MAQIIRNEVVAKSIMDELNLLSVDLHLSGIIKEKVQFYITDLVSSLNKFLQMDKINFTPALLVSRSFQNEGSISGVIRENYAIDFQIEINNRDDVEIILKEYWGRIATNNRYEVNDWVIAKEIFVNEPSNDYRKGNGDNKTFFNWSFNETWNYILNGINGNQVEIEIDGEKVRALQFSYENDKNQIINVEYGNNVNELLNTERITLVLPVQSEGKVGDILKDITNNTFNKEYLISFNFGGTKVVNMFVLRHGNVRVADTDKLVVFTVTFYKALKRTQIKINGESVKVLNFGTVKQFDMENYMRDKKQFSAKLMGVIGHELSILYQDGSELFDSLIDEVYGESNGVYKIEIEVKNKTFIKNMTIVEGKEGWEENGELKLDLILIEVE